MNRKQRNGVGFVEAGDGIGLVTVFEGFDLGLKVFGEEGVLGF